jgi:membrane associated rhomboid family serine protease
MKALHVFSRSKISLLLVCLLVLVFLIDFVLFIHSYLVFTPAVVLSSLLQWYRTITYPVVNPRLLGLLATSIFLLVSGTIIEPRIGKNRMFTLIIGSAIVGALSYLLLWVLGFEDSGSLAGIGSIFQGYLGVQFACWIKHRNTLSKAVKIYTLLMLIWVIIGALSFPSGFIAACFGLIFGLWAQQYQVKKETGVSGSESEAIEV